MSDHIRLGDCVRVDFNGAQITLSHKATVIARPDNEDNSWIFKDCNSGTIYYVSEGCTLTKLEKNNE